MLYTLCMSHAMGSRALHNISNHNSVIMISKKYMRIFISFKFCYISSNVVHGFKYLLTMLSDDLTNDQHAHHCSATRAFLSKQKSQVARKRFA